MTEHDYRQTKREAAALLRAASVYVRQAWSKEVNARDDNGMMVDPECNAAACWCAQGAMMAAFRHLGMRHPYLYVDENTATDMPQADAILGRRQAVTEVARMALREVADIPLEYGIPHWNDHIVEDAEEVAASMVAAAESLEVAA